MCSFYEMLNDDAIFESEMFKIWRGKIFMVRSFALWCGDMYRVPRQVLPPRVVVKAVEEDGPCHVLTFAGMKLIICWPLSRSANYTASEVFVSRANPGKRCSEKKWGLEWERERDMKQRYRARVWANQEVVLRAISAQMGYWWRPYCAGID